MSTTIQKTKKSKVSDEKASQIVKYPNGDYCMSWLGEYDEEDHPMLRGKLYRPGARTCNHRDCVRPSHWVRDKK